MIMNQSDFEKYTGCLLGGAVGDALGAPVEFMTAADIRAKYGSGGVTTYVEFPDGHGEFTDDTQMTLFTAEAVLRTVHREVLRGISGAYLEIAYHSYLRWLSSQGITIPNDNIINDDFPTLSGWLIKEQGLFKQRAPGNTCLRALRSGAAGSIERPLNNSKGCGGIMRVAPLGLFFNDSPEDAFKHGSDAAAITHGHPSGYLSAGFLCSPDFLPGRRHRSGRSNSGGK